MPKYIQMIFRITNSGNTNMIRLFKDEKTNHIHAWGKCGLNGKVTMWNNPIEQGNGTYNFSEIQLLKTQTGFNSTTANLPFAKLIFSRDILKSPAGAMGTYVEVDMATPWQAVYVGSEEIKTALLNQLHITA